MDDSLEGSLRKIAVRERADAAIFILLTLERITLFSPPINSLFYFVK